MLESPLAPSPGCARFVPGAVLCGLLLVPMLSSAALASSFAWTSCMNGGSPNQQVAASGPVSASISCGWGAAQASANDLAQSMAAHADGGGSTTAEEADAFSQMMTTLTVLPGTTGLGIGTPVTLRFALVASGSGSAGASGPANSYGYCDGTITYRITDAPAPGGSLVASFSAGVAVDAYYSETLNSTDYLYFSSADYYNALTGEYKEYYSRDTATLPAGSGLGNDNFIDFSTTVGAVLHLDAEVYGQAGGGPNLLGQLGPATGSFTLSLASPPSGPSPARSTSAATPFTPAPGCNCDGLELVIGPVAPTDVVDATPSFRLHRARPNPFGGSTVVSYELARPGGVAIEIYDASGRLVRRLADGTHMPAGPGQVTWDGRDLMGHPAATGVYLCRLSAGGRVATQRLLLRR